MRDGWLTHSLLRTKALRKKPFGKRHFVAIGTNLPLAGTPPIQLACEAARAIARITGSKDVCLARWYSSAPVPASEQPRYVNGMLRFRLDIAPEALLALLQGIEHRAGRHRGAANAARTLDLDLIDSAGLVRDGPDPVLPHPRAHLRAFVLRPLRDVAPDWVHPRLGLEVGALLAALPAQDVRPL